MASIRLAKSPWPWLAKRLIRARVMTGVGTPRLMASRAVQRPSPESATWGAMPSRLWSFFRKSAVRSSSQERTTELWRQSSEMAARSRSNAFFAPSRAKPSANACIMPYSMPLWTILVKWPAPTGPACSQPVSGVGANTFRKGMRRVMSWSEPPAIRQ